MKFPTYWNYSVYVNDRILCSSGSETLENCLARAFSDCIYYKANYPQDQISIREVFECCTACHNTGEKKGKRCQACKGKLATGKLGTIPLIMPDPANNIKLFME